MGLSYCNLFRSLVILNWYKLDKCIDVNYILLTNKYCLGVLKLVYVFIWF